MGETGNGLDGAQPFVRIEPGLLDTLTVRAPDHEPMAFHPTPLRLSHYR